MKKRRRHFCRLLFLPSKSLRFPSARLPHGTLRRQKSEPEIFDVPFVMAQNGALESVEPDAVPGAFLLVHMLVFAGSARAFDGFDEVHGGSSAAVGNTSISMSCRNVGGDDSTNFHNLSSPFVNPHRAAPNA
jgi:hypothetical protein